MKTRLEILRQKSADSEPYISCFDYEYTDPDTTVATALRELNKREYLTDTNGERAEKISWECSCLQKKCGACAMRINSVPRLACDVKLTEAKNGVIRLEPLKKFPVVRDLTVDRKIIFDDLKALEVWFEENAEPNEKRAETVHNASRCLQCGCCLEVCPNFLPGAGFKGMSACVSLSAVIAEMSVSEQKRVYKNYSKYFYAGCGKSLSCRDICPAGIDTEELMVNSNAAAVWKRKRK